MGHPSLDLTGKVAVVVGGTAGIGRALSLGMAEAGADVVACARTAETVESTAKEIEARGRRTVSTTADVTNRASLEDPGAFLRHDVRFHQALAEGCGNRVLAALMEMVAAQFYEQRKDTVEHARNLRDSAEMHRRIFRAIRAHDVEGARLAMAEHLEKARHAQDLEAQPTERNDER